MGKIMDVVIDPDIELDENRVEGMSYDLKQYLLITLTIAMERYNCGWRELFWKVKINDGQPVINVKKL